MAHSSSEIGFVDYCDASPLDATLTKFPANLLVGSLVSATLAEGEASRTLDAESAAGRTLTRLWQAI
jgi:hypothetical protein